MFESFIVRQVLRRDGRAVYCSRLENEQTLNGLVGSNPTFSSSFEDGTAEWSAIRFEPGGIRKDGSSILLPIRHIIPC